jgi:hypothetical protein
MTAAGSSPRCPALPGRGRDGLITAAVAQGHEADMAAQGLLPGAGAEDDTADWSIARSSPGRRRATCWRGSAEADLALPWLTHQSRPGRGQGCGLVRVSFAGELGWESTASRWRCPGDLRCGAGGRAAGAEALRHVRAEFLADRKGLSGLEGRSFDRLHRCCKAGSNASSTGRSRTSPARRRWRPKSSAA